MDRFCMLTFIVGVLSIAGCDEVDNYSLFIPLCDNFPGDDLTECARCFFERNAICNVVRKSNTNPVYREKFNDYFPKINVTLVTAPATVSNLNGDIEEFYINGGTGNLVMTVVFNGVYLESPSANFFISQRGYEPLKVTTNAYGTFPVVLTAVIPARRKPITKTTLTQQSTVTFFNPSPVIDFYIGPEFTASTDPRVQMTNAALITNIPTILQEIMLTEGTNFFLLYLQNYICDFGLPATSRIGGNNCCAL